MTADPSTARRAARAVVAGVVAWWAMDHVLQLIHDRHPADVLRRERAARGGVPALERLAERLAASAGVTLSEGARQRGGTVLQWMTGIGAGVLYAALRERLPGTGLRRGLGYGAAFSLVVDEGLVTLLGLAPPPWAFPWQTHARGVAGHLVFGAVAELTLTASCGTGSAARRTLRPRSGAPATSAADRTAL